MRVWQAGSHLTMQRGAEVEDWSWRRTRRRLATLAQLTAPYRTRTTLSIFSLLLATATALAPPFLSKYAIDDGIKKNNLGALWVIVAIFLFAGLANWGMSYVQTYLTGWVGERILADLRMKLFGHLQRLSLGFFERNRAGVIISRLTNDVEALDQLVTDGVTTLVQSTLTLIGTAIQPPVEDEQQDRGADHERRHDPVPDLLLARLCGGARAARARDCDAGRGHRGHADRASLHARGSKHRQLPRGRGALPRREHADGRPERRLLPVRRPRLDRRTRRGARLRRSPLLPGRSDARNPVRLPALRPELLRPGAAALAALQHVPLRDGGARQDHGRLGRGASRA